MEIKEYDLVKYNNGIYRVMSIINQTVVNISIYGPIHISSLELDKSAILPSLSVGDRVIVKPIPLTERNYYPTGWRDEMSRIIDSGNAYKITDFDWEDNTCKVGGFWFAPYHLEKVDDYDMI